MDLAAGLAGGRGLRGRGDVRAEDTLHVLVGVAGLLPGAQEGRHLAAVADVEGLLGILLHAPVVTAQAGHPGTQLFAGRGEPGVQVDHPGEFVHRQGAQVDKISSVYHCATVALKMSSTILSMMVSHRAPSTASRDWVASKSS